MKHWMLTIENPQEKIICPKVKGKGAIFDFDRCTERYKAVDVVDNGCRDCKVYLQECIDRTLKGLPM